MPKLRLPLRRRVPIINLQRRPLAFPRRRTGGYGLPGPTSDAQRVSRLHWSSRYAVALLAAAGCAALHAALGEEAARTPFLVYVPAIVAAGIYGGMGPGLAATALSAAAAMAVAVPPRPLRGAWLLGTPLVVFAGVGLTISYFTYALHGAVRTLRGNEQGFRSIVDGVVDYAIFMLDASGRIASWNAGAERIKGYAAQEIIGSHFSRFYPPEDVAAGKPQWELEEAARAGSVQDEGWRVRKDGTRFWANVVITALKDENGTVIGFTKITRDLTERREAEEASRERYLRTIIDSLPALVSYVDRDLRYVFVNDAYQEWFGAAAVPGAHMREVVGEKAFETIRPHVERAVAGERVSYEGEVDYQAAGKRWVHAEYVPAPEPKTGASRGGFFVFVTDQTERKRSEEAMRRSERKYRSLFDSMDEGFCIIEMILDEAGKPVDYRFLETNPAFERHTGLAGAQGNTIRSMAPAHESRWFETYGRIARTGKPERFESKAEALGFWYEVYAWRTDEDGHVAVLFSDITERKRADEAVLLAERRLRTIIDEMPALISYIDKDERYVFNNKRYVEWYVRPLAEITGRTIREVLGPELYEKLRPSIRKVLDGSFVTFEAPLKYPDRGRWVHAQFVPDRSEDGDIRGFFAFLNDISDERTRSETLAAAVADRTRELKRTVAELEGFSYTVSHDLRAPLRAIQGYTDFVLNKARDRLDPECVRLLERVSGSATRMDSLIKDVLTFGQLSRADYKMYPVDLDPVVAHVLEQYAEAGNVRLAVAGPLGWVVGQDSLLTQALSNLVDNAVKFAAEGRPAEIELRVERTNGRARVIVEDNGIGIPSEYHSKLFEPFVKLHAERKSEGTGIGLAIVRKAVERMGGRVGVESRAGHGSQFWFELPDAPR